jgi:regulator of replication initiation timing
MSDTEAETGRMIVSDVINLLKPSSNQLQSLSIENGDGEYISHDVLRGLIKENRKLKIQNEKFRRSLERIAAGDIAPFGSFQQWRFRTMKEAKEILLDINQ